MSELPEAQGLYDPRSTIRKLKELEKEEILKAVSLCKSCSEAARHLGCSTRMVQYKLKKWREEEALAPMFSKGPEDS